MSDPSYRTEHYIFAHDLIRSMGENLALHFQMEAASMDRETAQRHFDDRAAILRVQQMLLDEGERIIQSTSADI